MARTADMVCPWFSMTKIVTASLAMRLADRGLLNLDQPVLPLVPELTAMRPRALAERITARHLLTHSAGFANPIPVRWIHPAGQPARTRSGRAARPPAGQAQQAAVRARNPVGLLQPEHADARPGDRQS